jgi:hypothetical protein
MLSASPMRPAQRATASLTPRVAMRNANPMRPAQRVTASLMPRAKQAARMTANPAGRPKAHRNQQASNPTVAARIARPRLRDINPTPPLLRVTNPRATGHPANPVSKAKPRPVVPAHPVASRNGNRKVKANPPTSRAVPKARISAPSAPNRPARNLHPAPNRQPPERMPRTRQSALFRQRRSDLTA